MSQFSYATDEFPAIEENKHNHFLFSFMFQYSNSLFSKSK